MEKDRTVLLGIHVQFLLRPAELLGDDLGGIGLDDPTVAAKQIEEQPVRDCGAVRNAPSLDPGDESIGEFAAEFGEEARLADAWLADDADRLAVAIFGQPQEIVQDGAL